MPEPTAAAITLTNVTRRYGARAVVDNVSLTAPAGQVLALLGPSGSGKSTILRLIAGLEPVDAGEVGLGGQTVSTRAHTQPPEQRRVGFVFQDYALFPHLSAGANVAFGLAHLPRAERDARALQWLGRVGLGARAQAYPHELSGGEQQRVALARALAPSPRAVLLDEPFSGLDPSLRSELRDVALAAIAEARATAIFVTHHADEALLVADRLAVLREGRVLQEASPREVYAAPANAETAAALGPVNTYDAMVQNGVAQTPFGNVVATLPDGAFARVVVRAEAIALTDGASVRVMDRRPQGHADLVRLEASGGLEWRALIPANAPSRERANLVLDPAGAFVFAL